MKPLLRKPVETEKKREMTKQPKQPSVFQPKTLANAEPFVKVFKGQKVRQSHRVSPSPEPPVRPLNEAPPPTDRPVKDPTLVTFEVDLEQDD